MYISFILLCLSALVLENKFPRKPDGRYLMYVTAFYSSYVNTFESSYVLQKLILPLQSTKYKLK
jgi:hypothetical protein